MADIKLNQYILEQIAAGGAILFLGAGASAEAKASDGTGALSATQLRDVICDRFLDGKLKDRTLAEVAELAKNRSCLRDVQQVIADHFLPLEPTSDHFLMTQFRWHSIATTNFDLLIEKAYDKCSRSRLQDVHAIRRNDQLITTTRTVRDLPYLKLHGCVTLIDDPKDALVLATEEYLLGVANRDRILDAFASWAAERSVIFIGYSLRDTNIRALIEKIGNSANSRPHYILVSPDLTDIEIEYWAGRRVYAVKSDLHEFLSYLDRSISKNNRQLAALLNPEKSSVFKYIVQGEPTAQLLSYLETDLIHVHPTMSLDQFSAHEFYRGINSWSAIQANADVRRRQVDDALLDAVVAVEDLFENPKCILIKGFAGSGKSVVLRRIAWDAAMVFRALVFWVGRESSLNVDLIVEIHRLVRQRIIVVIEDAAIRVGQFLELLTAITKRKLPISIIAGARTNEWNSVGEECERLIDASLELTNLSEKEIDILLRKLEENGCLGALESLSPGQRVGYFKLTSERQILVALHEATSGKPFEEIVENEYTRLASPQAKALYLDVCTLHRLNVTVRAGLIARVSGITFVEFGERFLKPLEHVVKVSQDTRARDYSYRTRHPVIAGIVFERVLSDPGRRASQISRVIRSMNVEFESDRIAFEQLVRGRTLAELFGDRRYADQIFEAALSARANRSHVLHQKAVFELQHVAGDARSGHKAVVEAIEEQGGIPSDSLLHTKALALRALAKSASGEERSEVYRSEAKAILKKQIDRSSTSHSLNAYCRILLDEIHDLDESLRMNPDSELDQRVMFEAISELEQMLTLGRQRFPGDPHLIGIDIEIAKQLGDGKRLRFALEQGSEQNPTDSFLAVRYARLLREDRQWDDAEAVLLHALDGATNLQTVHLELARVIAARNAPARRDEVRRHLRSSFVDGDANYTAQFEYAAFEFEYGDRSKAMRYFAALKSARVSPELKRRVQRYYGGDSASDAQTCEGVVKSKLDTFCFVTVTDLGVDVFMHHTNFKEEDWESINIGTRFFLTVGLTFQGPTGLRPQFL